MKFLKNPFSKLKEIFSTSETNCKFLMILILIAFPIICLSIFDPYLDATGNLVTIRTAFSTLIGYILQKSTSTISTDNKLFQQKTIFVGIIAMCSLVVVIFSYLLDTEVNNPSLILIKNLLFSSIGFLTSASTN